MESLCPEVAYKCIEIYQKQSAHHRGILSVLFSWEHQLAEQKVQQSASNTTQKNSLGKKIRVMREEHVLMDFLSAPSLSSSHLQHWQGELGRMLISCRCICGKCLVPERKWVMFALCTFHLASLPGFPENQEQQVCLPQKSDMSMWRWPRIAQHLSSDCPMHVQHVFWEIPSTDRARQSSSLQQ